MKTLLKSFELENHELNQTVQLNLYHGADLSNAQHIDRDWANWFANAPGAQDAHWDWDDKLFRPVKDPFLYDVFVLEAEGTTQAVMLTLKGGVKCFSLHKEHPRSPLVYIDLLATAPWNRLAKSDPVKFKGCGQIMIGAAASLSINEGFKGRLGLHSLDGAEDFYRYKIGMSEFDPDPNYQNLRYFELSERDAANFLNKRTTAKGGQP